MDRQARTVIEIARHGGERWSRIQAIELPAVQTIHFAADGLIVRHDYVAEVISSLARGTHLWLDYVEVNGFPIATHRRVLARIGGQALPVIALDARLGTPEVTWLGTS